MKTPLLLSAFGCLAIACGEPSAVVIGAVDDGRLMQALSAAKSDDAQATKASGSITWMVNGVETTVAVDRDNGFAIQDLPSGELELSLEVEGIRGTLTIDEVQPGEVIEIAVSGGPGRLELRVIRREVPDAGSGELLVNDGSPIRIRAHKVMYQLESGTYSGAIEIDAHSVTLVGGGSCADPTVLEGKVDIHAHKIRLVNVALRGGQTLDGHDVKIVSSCR